MIDVLWVLIIGIIIAGAAYFGYAKSHKKGAMAIGAILVLVALFYPGYGYIDLGLEAAEPAALVGTTFDITAKNGSYVSSTATNNNCPQTVADDKESTVVQVNQDKSLDTFSSNLTSFNFTIKPTPPPGADNTALVTIYFSVDETVTHEGEPIFYESANVMQAIWSIGDSETTSNYEGSHTMLYTETEWVELRCELDGKGSDTFGDTMETVGETAHFTIDFWAIDNTGATIWSWDYQVNLICIKTTA